MDDLDYNVGIVPAYLAAKEHLQDAYGELGAVRADYIDLPDDALGHLEDESAGWGWQSQIVNLRLRTDSLAKCIGLDMPPFLVHNAVRLLEERVEALRQLVTVEFPLENA